MNVTFPSKPRRSLFRASVSLCAVALLATSCNYGGTGIFYSLQYETKIQNVATGLPSNPWPVIGAMALMDGWYYIATGAVYAAQDNTAIGATLAWAKVTPPLVAGNTGARCVQLLTVNTTTLYAIYFVDTASIPTAEGVGEVFVGSGNGLSITWTPLTAFNTQLTAADSTAIPESIYMLGPAGSQTLFVSVLDTVGSGSQNSIGVYSLWSFNGSTATEILSNLTQPVAGGVYDLADNEYWFISGYQVYETSSPTTAPSVAANQPPVQSNESILAGIYYTQGFTPSPANQDLLVSTRDGYTFANTAPDTGTWSSNNATGALEPMTGIFDFDWNGTDITLFGSDEGYYEYDEGPSGGFTNPFSPQHPDGSTPSSDINYISATLSTNPVLGFFLDPNVSGGRLFALTEIGLWRNEVNSSGSRTWEQD